MEVFWYLVIVFLLCMFFILDGYDFGAGIVQLFCAKTEADKKVIAKSAGLFWDSNEVWLVAAGGVIFMAFPTFYASAFSGFYLPLVIVLWLIIFRALGLELRSQFNYSMWQKIWDKSFGVSSLMLAFFFGVALGNMVRGVNLGGVENGVSAYEGHYFFLPLWSSSFSPLSVHPGVIDYFTIIIGLIAVLTLFIHGANWVILKTNSSINEKLKTNIVRWNSVLGVFTIFSIVVWNKINPSSFSNFIETPVLLLFPLAYLTGLVALYFRRSMKSDIQAFSYSILLIVGGISTSLASMFPTILPSTNDVNDSLTIYNTTTSEYGLSVAMIWGVIGLSLVVIYFFVQKKLLAGKIDEMDYGH